MLSDPNSDLFRQAAKAIVHAKDAALKDGQIDSFPRHYEDEFNLPEDFPHSERLSRKEYEKQKRALQVELLKLQSHVTDQGQRLVILFEGRDAAGKGGSIKRFTEHLNPRSAQLVALGTPTEKERGEWYFQRYARQLPTKGEIRFFDRSWYNRAGVEPVMGFCTKAEHKAFLREAPEFEHMLVRSGIRLLKLWFSVSRGEQIYRFYKRLHDPLKRWKLSPIDLASLGRWDDYTKVKKKMLKRTDTKHAPWLIIRSDDKKRARLNAMRFVLNQFDYPRKDQGELLQVNPDILFPATRLWV